MNDIAMVKMCAIAMGLNVIEVHGNTPQHTVRIKPNIGPTVDYWPIGNDLQAMALVKRFMLTIDAFAGSAEFPAIGDDDVFRRFSDESLNRAIVECVAAHTSATTETPSKAA